MSEYYFTSESVSEGHPDKVCDRISDEIVDYFLSKDSQSRVAVETLATTQKVVIAGEVRCAEPISKDDIIAKARDAVKDIGYTQDGFHWRDMDVDCIIHEQSKDIAQGVDANDHKDEGAGDQGIMFGYACRETAEFMPAPISYAHKILKNMAEYRHQHPKSVLRPDAKSQVTLLYRDGKPVSCHSLVVSTQHCEDANQAELLDYICGVAESVLPHGWMPASDNIYINPTGIFVIGGPDGDCGLTGRKIIVDTYGGAAPHGGGAFSGKDPTKVDRSAAYIARYLAKNIVAAKLAEKCVIQLSYAIGISQPLSIYVNSYGTSSCDESLIVKAIKALVDLSPRGIREKLLLNRPIYAPTAAYGHFGREAKNGLFTWENLDLVDDLQQFCRK